MTVIFSFFIILSLVHIVAVILIKGETQVLCNNSIFIHCIIIWRWKVFKIVPDMKEKLHFVGIVILLPMDIVCIILFILFGIILNGEASIIVQLYIHALIIHCPGPNIKHLIWPVKQTVADISSLIWMFVKVSLTRFAISYTSIFLPCT